MKKTTLVIALSLSACFNSNAQNYASKSASTSHHGFQASLYLGGAGGHVKGKIEDIGDLTIKGVTSHFTLHLGYAKSNWAGGLALGANSLSINTITLNRESLDKTGAGIESIGNSLTGIYVTKYFMPHNIFVTLEGGIGKFNLSDNEGNTTGETATGFAWDIRAGKEFLLGKKKNFGLGGYINLSGLKCHDKGERSNDIYSYVGPGLGLALSFH